MKCRAATRKRAAPLTTKIALITVTSRVIPPVIPAAVRQRHGDDLRAAREARAARVAGPSPWETVGPDGTLLDVTFSIEIEREDDGRWLAEVPDLPGVMCYGQDRDEAVAFVQALALRVIAERLEHREGPAEFLNVTFQAA